MNKTFQKTFAATFGKALKALFKRPFGLFFEIFVIFFDGIMYFDVEIHNLESQSRVSTRFERRKLQSRDRLIIWCRFPRIKGFGPLNVICAKTMIGIRVRSMDLNPRRSPDAFCGIADLGGVKNDRIRPDFRRTTFKPPLRGQFLTPSGGSHPVGKPKDRSFRIR